MEAVGVAAVVHEADLVLGQLDHFDPAIDDVLDRVVLGCCVEIDNLNREPAKERVNGEDGGEREIEKKIQAARQAG